MKKIVSILLRVLAGFFFYMVALLAFFSAPDIDSQGKLAITVIYFVPAILLLIVALALKGFQQWKRDSGIVLLASSAFAVFIVVMMYFMSMSEAVREIDKQQAFTYFQDYVTGGMINLAYILVGVLFLIIEPKRDVQPPTAPVSE